MKELLLTSVFLLTVCLVILIYIMLNSNKLRTSERMKIIAKSNNSNFDFDKSNEEEIETQIKVEQKKSYFLSTYYEKKRKKLAQAYILMKPKEFLLLSILISAVLFLLFYVFTSNLIVALMGIFIGFVIPDSYINTIKKKRGKKLNEQLPEALTIISNGLRAGLSFSQAISLAGRDLESPIADEFTKVLRDNTLGKSLEDSLLDFTNRTDDEDIDMFVTAMIIQRQVGGNLSEILDTISNTIRERVRLKGDVNTLTAQSKLSAVIISLLPVGVIFILYALNPGYIGLLFTTTLGFLMVGIAVFLQIIGITILVKMTKLKV